MDRLRRFWLTGVCKPHKEERQFSEPLATEQFLSAFLLLLSGIGLAFLLLALEHIYFRYVRSHLAKTTTGACCSLISIVSSRVRNPLPLLKERTQIIMAPFRIWASR